MISYLDKITVPGLQSIDFYRHYKKFDTFYAIRSTPVIARDQDGKPAMSYSLFARNADIAYASSANKDLVETQLGQLLVTVDLSLSKEEHKIATDYLRTILNKKSHPFVKKYHKRYKSKIPTTKIEPKIAYPNWKSGTAKLNILKGLGDTFTKSYSEEVKPSLTASNSAALYATFGVEGSQLMFDALSKGFSDEDGNVEKTPLQAIVHYELVGNAFIPNMEAKVSGHSSDIYDFLQEQKNTYKKEIEQGTRTRTRKRKILGITYHSSSSTTTYDKNIDIDKTDINSLVEKMIKNKVVTVEITNFSGLAPNSDEMKEANDALEKMLTELIFGTIVKSFFETSFIGRSENESEEGETASTGVQPNSDMGITGREKHIKNQDHYYYFKNDVKKSEVNNIYFHFKKNAVIDIYKNPQGSIAAQLTKSEREAAIRYIDVSSPEVQMLETQIKVNADFEADNIHSIIVNVSYKQKDYKSGIVRQNAKSFLFENGTEVFTFRASMARNEKGELLDFYKAEAKISYRGTSMSPPAIVLENISDRVLNVSYDKLGFITTQVTAGDIDWSMVKEAVVDLEYIAEPNKPDTKKTIRLSQENVSGNWKCFMYGHKDKKYRYKVKYFYQDGTESETEYKTDTRDVLSIDDNLIGRVKASFDLLIDTNTVTSAKVEILYVDESNQISEEYSKWFTGSETWDWSMRLRERATNKFKYRYFVQYTDGLVKTSAWKDAVSDEDIAPISLKRYKQSLMVDGGMVDWTQWKMVYAHVKYQDTENNYLQEKSLRLDENNNMQTFEILSFSPGGTEYECSLKYAGNGKIVDVASKIIKGGVLILENPKNENTVDSPTVPENN